MVARKSNSRRVADQMASYKRNAVVNGGSRKSTPSKTPPSKTSKTQSQASTRSTAAARRTRRSPGSQKVPSDEDVNETDEVVKKSMSRLECAVEIPETPPPEMQVAVRKRALAPQKLHFRYDGSEDDSVRGADDAQKPSKKRKSFNSPSSQRQKTSWDSQDQDTGGTEKDPTVLCQTNEQRGSERELILNMDPYAPVCPFKPTTENISDQIHDGWTHRKTAYGSDRVVSKASSQEENALDVLSASTQTLSRLFDSFRMRMTEEMRGLYKKQKSELREMNESITSQLLSEVRDMRGIVELLSNGTKGSSSGRPGSKTTLLTEWEEKLNRLTPKADAVFSTSVFARILCFNAPLKVFEVYTSITATDAWRASTAIQSLLFSHQPSSKKEDFSGGVGKLHSEFKYAVVQNTFYNVCKDSFDLFRSSQAFAQPGNDGAGGAGERNTRIKPPAWLQIGYVTVDHIDSARTFIELTNQSRKGKIRESPCSDDIASHGALRVYRQLGSHLHRGRDNMRTSFFQNLGYLFVPWKGYVSDIDQRKMKLWFEPADEEKGLNLDDVPSTDLCSFSASAELLSEVDASNKNLLKKLFTEWPGMVLHVEHDVHVTRGGSCQRKRTDGERKTLHRLINLIEVACGVIVEFIRVGSIERFLRGHRHALRCVMVFAFVIKNLTLEFIDMREAMEPMPEDAKKIVPDPLHVWSHSTCLKVFLPGKSVQENNIKGRCISIDEKIYDRMNVREDETDGLSDPRSGATEPDGREITASDELGIAAI